YRKVASRKSPSTAAESAGCMARSWWEPRQSRASSTWQDAQAAPPTYVAFAASSREEHEEAVRTARSARMESGRSLPVTPEGIAQTAGERKSGDALDPHHRGGLDLALDLTAEFVRIGDPVEDLRGPAGYVDAPLSAVQAPTRGALLDRDALHLGEEDLLGVPGHDARLDEHAPV